MAMVATVATAAPVVMVEAVGQQVQPVDRPSTAVGRTGGATVAVDGDGGSGGDGGGGGGGRRCLRRPRPAGAGGGARPHDTNTIHCRLTHEAAVVDDILWSLPPQLPPLLLPLPLPLPLLLLLLLLPPLLLLSSPCPGTSR